MMKIKLPWKLTFIFCSAALVGLLAGYFYLTSHLKSYLDVNLENNLKRELAVARDFLETHLDDQGALTDAPKLADRIGKDLGVRVTVVALDGTVIGDSELTAQELKQVENHTSRIEIQDALKHGFGISRRFSYTIKKYLLYEAVPFGVGQSKGVLRLAMPVSEIENFESRSRQIVFFALLLVFLLSLGFTYIISLVVSRPLREMSTIAQKMAKGDFSLKPSITSRDEMGELARAVSYMSEQVEDKIERLKQEGAKLDAVLSSMFEGIMVVDERGQVLLMNPSMRKSFFIEANPEGKRAGEVIRNTAVLSIIERLLQKQERFWTEEITLAAGEEKIFKVNAVLIMRNGRAEGAVLVFHDISQLRHLEKVRQDFVANVSHELRTPVSSIKGYAETLLEGAWDDKKNAREFLEIIQQNSDRLAHLINDLLDLSKIESGKMDFVLMPVELKGIVSRCLGVLEKTFHGKKQQVTVNIPASCPRVMADEARLSQVILNLLDNAVKYTPEGGGIKVTAVLEGKFLRVDVEDTGVGIPEKDIPRIFERFYRVDKARSRDLGGTGLGLSIVKHIVLAHGGEVRVRSQVGAGSTFSFTIPTA
ncbi:MAG: HAMP domain-containing protein [Candidatus Omnitrophica bacterium]|nr:HAMP domain-containing protein [Candidatus Omnitrophota bacterium]